MPGIRPEAISTATIHAAMAEEALAFHLDGMTEDDEAIPEPSSLDIVMQDRENRDGVAILVTAKPTRQPKVVRVNVTLPEDVLEEIDRYAEARGLTRSGFLARAARQKMQEPA